MEGEGEHSKVTIQCQVFPDLVYFSSLPSSREALALNSIKQLDANLNVFENIISLESDEDGITSKHNLFGRQIFKFLNVD